MSGDGEAPVMIHVTNAGWQIKTSMKDLSLSKYNYRINGSQVITE